jgi:hypothetical protein
LKEPSSIEGLGFVSHALGPRHGGRVDRKNASPNIPQVHSLVKDHALESVDIPRYCPRHVWGTHLGNVLPSCSVGSNTCPKTCIIFKKLKPSNASPANNLIGASPVSTSGRWFHEYTAGWSIAKGHRSRSTLFGQYKMACSSMVLVLAHSITVHTCLSAILVMPPMLENSISCSIRSKCAWKPAELKTPLYVDPGSLSTLLELEIKHKHGGFNINYEKATVVWQQFGFGL